MKARVAALRDSSFLGLAALSVAALVALRLYAALATVPAETPWDDRHYRQEALADAAETSLAQAAGRVFLPNDRSFFIRTVGYNEVLVLGLELARAVGLEDSELAFQLTNVALLLVQLAALGLLALWATGSLSFALAFAFLYLSTPLVFGMNRWILTENLVAPGLLVASLSACWLLSRRPAAGKAASRIWAPALAAYLTGIFATIREYAVPVLVAVALCVLLGLLIERRRLEAAIYVGVLMPFALAAAGPALHAVRMFLAKAGAVKSYYHPLETWIHYLFFHGVGPPMAVLVGAGLVTGTYLAVRDYRGRGRQSLSHLLLFSGFLALLAFYVFQLAMTRVRVVRPVLMPMLLVLILLLLGARLLPSLRDLVRRSGAVALVSVLILASWGVLSYQLWFAFDGGRSYLFGPRGPEVLNYPLGLRPLVDAEDSHTVTQRSAEARLERLRQLADEALREEIAELLENPAPEARRRLRERILREPYLGRPSPVGDELIVSAVWADFWTYGAGPAALVATNPGNEPRVFEIGLAVMALPRDYPITVFVDDGESVRRHEFNRAGVRTVRLQAIPPAGDRLFLVWSSKAWRRTDDGRLLGVQLRAPEVDPAGRRAELLARMSALRFRPDATAREELLADLRHGDLLAPRLLGSGRVAAYNVTRSLWTTGESPAAILVENGGEEAMTVVLRVSRGAGTLPLSLFVEDGRQTVEHRLAGGRVAQIPLPEVAARSEALFLIWTDRTWTPGASDSRRLGVRLKAVRILRPGDDVAPPER